MKKFTHYFAYLAMFALVFTSCSKDEISGNDIDSEKAILSFGAILEGMNTTRAAEKAHLDDFPECSDAAAAYVEIVLMQGSSEVVGTSEDPYRVDLAPGQNFTVEDAALELVPGNYSLEHFMVYSADGTLIWTAPRNGSTMAGYVDSALPMNIDLGAGVKKYVEVDVLCFDNRDVTEYGYLFFDVNQNRAIEFCIFGNFCGEDGRHYTAAYSVNVWSWSNGQMGTQIYTNLESNVTVNADGDYTASPLCVALPDREGEDEYYFEITLMDAASYGDVENRVVRAGVITDGDVRDLMTGANDIDYYHFRAGNCGNTADSPNLFDADIYYAGLSSLNNSGVSGFASLIHMDNKLRVNIYADGLVPNMVHPQHIHGLMSDENAVCPPSPGEAGFAAADTNGDGVIDLAEGAPFYGPVLLELYEPIDEFPVANADGEIYYSRTFTLGATEFEEEGAVPTWEELAPLVNRAIVLHGMFFQGEYVPSLPVACGQIEMWYDAQ